MLNPCLVDWLVKKVLPQFFLGAVILQNENNLNIVTEERKFHYLEIARQTASF
jgi:hypothetical protein